MSYFLEVVFLLVLLTFISSVTSDVESDDMIIINALGRTFTLGMMYNRRTDQIIAAITAWDEMQLQQNISRRDFPSSKYEVQTRDSIQDKARFMKVEAGIKASFLCGLFSVEGSAEYLNDFRSSKKHARMTVKYSAETHFEQLTMAHLSRNNIRYPEVLENDEATHVVVGIEYGVQAYFIFEKRVEDFDRTRVYGQLKAVVDRLPLFRINANGRVEIQDEISDYVNEMSISFHGDFVLPVNPSTFEEAVRLYKDLPTYVTGENAQSVPMKIYLYPLKKLDPSGTFSIIRDIAESLIDEVVTVMQELEDAKKKKVPTATLR